MRQWPGFYREDAPDGQGSPTGTAPAPDPNDSSAIRQAREHAKSLEQQLKTAKSALEGSQNKLTALEREKMGELERLQAENKDLLTKSLDMERLKGEVDKAHASFAALFETKLAALPKEVQEAARSAAMKVESPSDRVDIVAGFEAAIAAVKPAQVGAATNPTQIGTHAAPTKAEPAKVALTPDQIKSARLTWSGPLSKDPGYQG